MATAKWDIQDKFPQPLLRVVGQITIAAGQLEYVLKLAYKRARGEGMEIGMAAAEKLPFKDLCDETQKYFDKKITDPALQQQLSKILTDANQAWLDRHTVIHAVFAISLQDNELKRYFKKKAKGKVKNQGKYYDVGVKELRALRNRLRDARDDLHFFTKKYLLGARKGS